MDFSIRFSSLTPELPSTPNLQEIQKPSDGAKQPLSKIRRANAHPDISRLRPKNIPSENMRMPLYPETRQALSSAALKLIAQAQELFDLAQYQARDL